MWEKPPQSVTVGLLAPVAAVTPFAILTLIFERYGTKLAGVANAELDSLL